MSFAIHHPESIRAQRKTALFTALVGSIPLSIGKKLRHRAYRFIFGKIGSNVNIDPHVQFICAQAIEFGDSANICSYSVLNCWDPGSKLIVRDNVRIDQGTHIQAMGGTVEIGARSYVGPYVCMAGPGNISIGQDCLIASGCGIYANNHIFADPTRPINQQGAVWRGIVVEEDCWLGSGVRVLDGVTIGRGSVIGAGAVVSKDIPPYSIAVGVPAKVISTRGATPIASPVLPANQMN